MRTPSPFSQFQLDERPLPPLPVKDLICPTSPRRAPGLGLSSFTIRIRTSLPLLSCPDCGVNVGVKTFYASFFLPLLETAGAFSFFFWRSNRASFPLFPIGLVSLCSFSFHAALLTLWPRERGFSCINTYIYLWVREALAVLLFFPI